MSILYDSHCHTMNLSHPNLSAIISRVYVEVIKPQLKRYLFYLILIPIVVWLLLKVTLSLTFLEAFYRLSLLTAGSLVFLLLLFAIPAVRESMVAKMKDKLGNVMNLLAIMETDIGDCFIQMEEDLRKNFSKNFSLNNGLVISGDGEPIIYEKIVLTPLIMDFGLKKYEGETKLPYKVRWKPIVGQVEDLCIGIRDYYVYRDNYIDPSHGGARPFFQIFPFMGINTRNYDMCKKVGCKGISIALEELLQNNFGKFKDDATPQMRRKSLEAINWIEFDGSIKSIGSHYFIGIKVYPPLGFNPWPVEEWESNAAEEMEKVCYLYQFCLDNNIPITAHCSDGGFLVDKNYKDLSSPFKWEPVLKKYPKLRLNLAHFGGVAKKDWRKKIVDLILEPEYENFYTDISYQGVNKKSYDDLRHFVDSYDPEQRARLMEHIIFGTDFMINLQNICTYSEYLKYFVDTQSFSVAEKDLLCNKNAEKFLFIG
jgi:hypothetical protein